MPKYIANKLLKNKARKIIIIGGGTSGAIIAKNLAPKYEVVVFEKSEKNNLPLLHRIPLLIGLLLSKKNDYIKQIAIKFNDSRLVPFFESQSLGGASVINGCVHVMGSHHRWTNLVSRFGLNLDDLNSSYKNLYSKDRQRGKLALSENVEKKMDKVFFSALEKNGISRGDVEWADSQSFGPVINTVGRFFRSSVMSLNPFIMSKIKSGLKVERLVVDNSLKVIGIVAGGEIFFADTIILSAGVLGTNGLMKKKALRFSDKSLIDLGLGAGKGIKDHANLRVNVESVIKINSLNEINSKIFRKITLFFGHLFGFKTLMMGTGATSAAHLDLDNDGQVDARIQLLNFSETGRMGSGGRLFSSEAPGFSISITAINPKSIGNLDVSGDVIAVEPNYLSDPLDMEHLQKCLCFVVNLLESNSFQGIVKRIDRIQEIKKNPKKYIQDNAYSGYHLIGGCGDLVDSDFQVRGHQGLFICDASILTEYVSSNIHSTILLLADMFSKKFTKSIAH